VKKIILLLAVILIFSGCFSRQRDPKQIRQVKEEMDMHRKEAVERQKAIEETTENINQGVREFRRLIRTKEVTVDDLNRFRDSYKALEQIQNNHIYSQDVYIRRLENLAGGLLDPKERIIPQQYSVFERGL